MNAPTQTIRTAYRRPEKEASTALEIMVAVVTYAGLFALIMADPLSSFTVWGS